MEITEVKVFPIQEEKLRAFVSIVIDRCFMVNDIKVIQGRDGLFISMPSRRKKNGDFKDIAHPLNNETRRTIEERILTEYEGVVGERVQRRAHRVETEAVAAVGEVAAVGAVELPQAAAAAAMVPPAMGQTLDEVQEQHLSDSFWTVR
jgi:stage V sporulation protein G